MDQGKIGKFILEERKKKGYTQKQLADILCVSDKTISKWENGNGIPDISLLLPLCEEFKISVNELLSGERLADTEYKQKAEENMVRLVQENQQTTYQKIKSLWELSSKVCVFYVGFPLLLVTLFCFFISPDITAPFALNSIAWMVLGCIAKILYERENKKRKTMKAQGIRQEADIIKLLPSALFRIGNYVTCRIQCTCISNENQYFFNSSYVLLTHFDTKETLKAIVYYDAENMSNYCVELFKTESLQKP